MAINPEKHTRNFQKWRNVHNLIDQQVKAGKYTDEQASKYKSVLDSKWNAYKATPAFKAYKSQSDSKGTVQVPDPNKNFFINPVGVTKKVVGGAFKALDESYRDGMAPVATSKKDLASQKDNSVKDYRKISALKGLPDIRSDKDVKVQMQAEDAAKAQGFKQTVGIKRNRNERPPEPDYIKNIRAKKAMTEQDKKWLAEYESRIEDYMSLGDLGAVAGQVALPAGKGFKAGAKIGAITTGAPVVFRRATEKPAETEEERQRRNLEDAVFFGAGTLGGGAVGALPHIVPAVKAGANKALSIFDELAESVDAGFDDVARVSAPSRRSSYRPPEPVESTFKLREARAGADEVIPEVTKKSVLEEVLQVVDKRADRTGGIGKRSPIVGSMGEGLKPGGKTVNEGLELSTGIRPLHRTYSDNARELANDRVERITLDNFRIKDMRDKSSIPAVRDYLDNILANNERRIKEATHTRDLGLTTFTEIDPDTGTIYMSGKNMSGTDGVKITKSIDDEVVEAASDRINEAAKKAPITDDLIKSTPANKDDVLLLDEAGEAIPIPESKPVVKVVTKESVTPAPPTVKEVLIPEPEAPKVNLPTTEADRFEGFLLANYDDLYTLARVERQAGKNIRTLEKGGIGAPQKLSKDFDLDTVAEEVATLKLNYRKVKDAYKLAPENNRPLIESQLTKLEDAINDRTHKLFLSKMVQELAEDNPLVPQQNLKQYVSRLTEVRPRLSSYMKAQISRGLGGTVEEALDGVGIVDWKTKAPLGTKSIKAIYESIAGNEEDFLKLGALKRLANRGTNESDEIDNWFGLIKSGEDGWQDAPNQSVTLGFGKWAQDELDRFEAELTERLGESGLAKLNGALTDVHDYYRGLLSNANKARILSEEQLNRIANSDEIFFPLRTKTDSFSPQARSLTSVKSGVRTWKNVVGEETENAAKRVVRTRDMDKVRETLDLEDGYRNEFNSMLSRVKSPITEMIADTTSGYKSAANNEILQNLVFIDQLGETGALSFIKGKISDSVRAQVLAMPKGGKYVRVLFDGQEMVMQVNDKYLYEVLRGFKGKEYPAFLKAVTWANQWMKEGITNSPVFAVSNAVRDKFEAAATGKFGLKDLSKSVIPFDKKLAQELKVSGGTFGSNITDNRSFSRMFSEVTPPELADDLIKAWRSDKNWSVVKQGKKALGWLWKGGGLSDATETGTRLAVYNRAKNDAPEILLTENLNDINTLATFLAKDRTINFSKTGYLGRELNKFLLFYNPSVQGLGKAIENTFQSPTRYHAFLGAFAGFEALMWYVNHDDAQYKNIDDWVKDSHYLIPVGKLMSSFGAEAKAEWSDRYIAIPKAHQLAILPNVLRRTLEDSPETFYDFIGTKKPEGVIDNASAIEKIFDIANPVLSQADFPSFTIAGATQLAENTFNYDFFRKRRQQSPFAEKRHPSNRVQRSTSETAKALSGGINSLFEAATHKGASQTSPIMKPINDPIKVQNLFKTLGTQGEIASSILDQVGGAVGLLEDKPKDSLIKQIPVVGQIAERGEARFIKNPNTPFPKDLESLYQSAQVVDQIKNEIKTLRQEGNSAEAKVLMLENKELLKQGIQINKLLPLISKLQKQHTAIEKNASLSPMEKDKAQFKITQQIETLINKVNP